MEVYNLQPRGAVAGMLTAFPSCICNSGYLGENFNLLLVEVVELILFEFRSAITMFTTKSFVTENHSK